MKDNTKENIESKTFTATSSSVASFATYKNPYERFSEENALKEGEIIKCPHCGKSYYSMGYMSSTCIGYNRIFKDGVEITKDPNYHTTQCHCLECNKDFCITVHEGKTYVQ